MKKNFLLGLTTISPDQWKNKIKEIDELKIKEIALFPTCLDLGQRKELYQLLEKTKLEKTPHVHLRHDSESWELDYLVDKYKTEAFNVHPDENIREFLDQNQKYKNIIYVENLLMDDNFEEIVKYCGGICLDISHWEDHGRLSKRPGYEKLPGLIKKYKIGCNHISAVNKKTSLYRDSFYNRDFYNFSNHRLAELNEVDYVKNYKAYLSDIISLELENSFSRQLEVKEYLEKIIK